MKINPIYLVLLCGCTNSTPFIVPQPPPPPPAPISESLRYEEGYENGLQAGIEKGSQSGYDSGYRAGHTAGRNTAILEMSKDEWTRIPDSGIYCACEAPINVLADLRKYHKDTTAMRKIRREAVKGAHVTIGGTIIDVSRRSYPDIDPDKGKNWRMTIQGTGEYKGWIVNASVEDVYISVFNRDDEVTITGNIFDIGETDWIELTNYEIYTECIRPGQSLESKN